MAFSAITSGHKNALALSLRLKNADGFQLQGNMLAHKLLLFFFFFFLSTWAPMDQTWLIQCVRKEAAILWPPDAKEPIHWKRPCCWERRKAKGEEGSRG